MLPPLRFPHRDYPEELQAELVGTASIRPVPRDRAFGPKEVCLQLFRSNYLATMTALATAGFGLLAAGAWNIAIGDLLKTFLPHGTGVFYELVYAAIVTILAVIVINALGRLADKETSEIKK